MWLELGGMLSRTCGPLSRAVRLPYGGPLGPRPHWWVRGKGGASKEKEVEGRGRGKMMEVDLKRNRPSFY